MQTIGLTKLWSFFDDRGAGARVATNSAVRHAPGHTVHSFLELATKVAELQFMNRDPVLLFRGQGADHRNARGNTSLKPSLLRTPGGRPAKPALLAQRFEHLEAAEAALVDLYGQAGLLGVERLRRHRILRWSILQHYEICPTPLLDVTHSLRIAASFATHAGQAEGFVFVLGVPHLGGGITASAEAGLQTVRLSSVCPPSALRPHLQEGYLLGEYPELAAPSQQALYEPHEVDFGRRLVAKFRFEPDGFWRKDTFPLVAGQALYPALADDPLARLAAEVRARLAAQSAAGSPGPAAGRAAAGPRR